MDRRGSFIAVLAAAAGCGPLGALAADERPRRPLRIGLLPDFSPNLEPLLGLFRETLRGLGRIEGRDYELVRSGVFYGGDAQAAVDRVMAASPDLVLVLSLGLAVAAQRRTKTIPIVMWVSGFPVEAGLARSLSQPGRNVTGVTLYAGGEVFGKLVQLVHEARPSARRVGALVSYVPPVHPRAEADVIERGLRDAAGPGLDVRVFEVARPEQVDEALAWVSAQGIEALVLTSGAAMKPRMKEIFEFAVARRLPAIVDAPWDELGEPQPLLGYWASFPALIRQAVPYVNQILWNGAKPGDLPIQLPAQFEFVVDLRTAKAIGVTVPPRLLVRADRVVQ